MKIKSKIAFLLLNLTALLILVTAISWGATQGGDTVTVLKTEKLSCGSCAARITDALKEKAGVVNVEVNIAEGKVTVWHEQKQIPANQVATVVTDTGYPSTVVRTVAKDAFEKEAGKSNVQQNNIRTGCACCNKDKK